MTVNPELLVKKKISRDDENWKKRAAAEMTLAKLPEADIEVFTDGPVGAGPRKSGSGFYANDNRSGQSHFEVLPAGEFCSSFRAEQVALIGALDWLVPKEEKAK